MTGRFEPLGYSCHAQQDDLPSPRPRRLDVRDLEKSIGRLYLDRFWRLANLTLGYWYPTIMTTTEEYSEGASLGLVLEARGLIE